MGFRLPGTPKAKSLIFLNMKGGPSQFETFDYKPDMAKWDGKAPPIPENKAGLTKFAPTSTIVAPRFKYLNAKRSDLKVAEPFPLTAGILDELCVIRSMHGDSPAHGPGVTQSMTGHTRPGMPSFGSWLMYGLGSANKNLPGFVYLAEGFEHQSAFLPAVCQGMPVGTKVPNLKRSALQTEASQRELLDHLAEVNRGYASHHPHESSLAARIEAAELAFRMQAACPEAVDLTTETKETLTAYGLSGAKAPAAAGRVGMPLAKEEFAAMCLTARRLVERGVRVVTVMVGGRNGWDQHSRLKDGILANAAIIDQAVSALITDLKSRGLLESTIVMWGGEFGRTPYAQGAGADGRDHFAKAYTYWLAGGGFKKGIYHGETDELGMTITKDPVHVRDLHATILQQFGIDHRKLTFRYSGRDQSLTDVDGHIIPGLIS